MEARILDESEEHLWDEFIINHSLSTIHQTSSWGHFQEKIPQRGKYWIVVLENSAHKDSKSKIIGGTMLIRHSLPKGYSWLYMSRGPLINYNSEKCAIQMNALIDAIKLLAKKEKAIFLRIDPPIKLSEKSNHKDHLKGFHITHSGFQPEHTLLLDLTKSEEELLKEMKPKGRYNIHLAEKKEVKIRTSDPANKTQFNKDIEAYFSMLKETTSRDNFSGHNKEIYKNMIEILAQKKLPNTLAKLYIAEYENTPIAAIITTYYKDMATYYYGVSGNSFRNLMAPYLLQWEAIKDAKKQGYKIYDFLGIAPSDAKNHPWKGVTEFKTKFGGHAVSYNPPQEFAFKKFLYLLYRLYKLVK